MCPWSTGHPTSHVCGLVLSLGAAYLRCKGLATGINVSARCGNIIFILFTKKRSVESTV